MDCKKQLTYHIVPFQFNNRFGSELVSQLQRGKESLWQAKNGRTHYLYEHIDGLISDNIGQRETIGTGFALKNEKRNGLGLPNKYDTELVLAYKKDSCISFFLKDILLYLFETQVGFLVFELGLPEGCTPDDLIELNYNFKKISMQHMIGFDKRVRKEGAEAGTPGFETIRMQFAMAGLIRELLTGLEVCYFDYSSRTINKEQLCETAAIPNQALVFSVVLLNRKPDDKTLGEYMFRMRRSFKESYKPAPSELSLDNEEVRQMFDNCYWGVSQEGMANLSFLTGDETCDRFFESGFFDSVKNNYFYFYIIALHQRYALLNFSKLASALPNGLNKLTRHKGNILKEKIISFTLRASFGSVSVITHHNDLYKTIINVLGIEELMNNLRQSVDGITDLVRLREDETRDRIIYVVSVIAALLTVIQAGSSLKDLLFDDYPIKSAILICIYVMLGVIGLGWLCYYVFWFLRFRLNERHK